MNEQLIKFIELCLEDGVISDKEREVIFRKSKELGVPDDECEILIDSLVSKHSRGSNQSEKPKKKGGFFSSMFNEIKNNIDTESIRSSYNKVKEDFQKGMENTMSKGPSIQKKEEIQREITKPKVQEEKEQLQMEQKKEQLQLEQGEQEQLQKERYISRIKELDSDGNGKIDVVDGDDYGKILKINQEKIIEINRDYIKQFVQISNYLKTKRKSLQNIYDRLLKFISDGVIEISIEVILKKGLTTGKKLDCVSEIKEKSGLSLKESLEIVDRYFRDETFDHTLTVSQPIDEQTISEYIEILKDDSHIYNVLLVQSITMVQSLIKNDMITFYEIYEKLDQLNMFDSKHEKDIKNILGEVNHRLEDIMKEIREVGQNIVSSIDDLSLITEETGQLVKEGLDSVNSSIQTNNLLTGIQTYQLYKINKNTKSLRG
ncbi:MAG: hypothetical protein ACPG21_04090 [Crocinitomicaceae bacterium]